MNENRDLIALRDFMDDDQGWGRDAGRIVYQRLLGRVEAAPGVVVFRCSFSGVRRVDISFASETVVELAKRYRGVKGFCLVDLDDIDMIENVDAAAIRKAQPLMLWADDQCHVVGPQPSQGNREALAFALARPIVRAAEYAQANPGTLIANASSKFRQLWEQGFLLRREAAAESGGVEYGYFRVK